MRRAISRRLVPRYPFSANKLSATANTRSRVSGERCKSTTLADRAALRLVLRGISFLEQVTASYLTHVRSSSLAPESMRQSSDCLSEPPSPYEHLSSSLGILFSKLLASACSRLAHL